MKMWDRKTSSLTFRKSGAEIKKSLEKKVEWLMMANEAIIPELESLFVQTREEHDDPRSHRRHNSIIAGMRTTSELLDSLRKNKVNQNLVDVAYAKSAEGRLYDSSYDTRPDFLLLAKAVEFINNEQTIDYMQRVAANVALDQHFDLSYDELVEYGF